ncbi:hypothetical protein BLNAU_3568 [Blattamonas nauphoetae]|uniref:Uncharacterized protein n=1 Tax=Blattamonas nauphoetae TaxID=2049346 RepID=A0ABQ9YCI3_9EUKA|nr:hypothetical protein BLNAU_3568 [Blattamonas nauphoetae]
MPPENIRKLESTDFSIFSQHLRDTHSIEAELSTIQHALAPFHLFFSPLLSLRTSIPISHILNDVFSLHLSRVTSQHPFAQLSTIRAPPQPATTTATDVPRLPTCFVTLSTSLPLHSITVNKWQIVDSRLNRFGFQSHSDDQSTFHNLLQGMVVRVFLSTNWIANGKSPMITCLKTLYSKKRNPHNFLETGSMDWAHLIRGTERPSEYGLEGRVPDQAEVSGFWLRMQKSIIEEGMNELLEDSYKGEDELEPESVELKESGRIIADLVGDGSSMLEHDPLNIPRGVSNGIGQSTRSTHYTNEASISTLVLDHQSDLNAFDEFHFEVVLTPLELSEKLRPNTPFILETPERIRVPNVLDSLCQNQTQNLPQTIASEGYRPNSGHYYTPITEAQMINFKFSFSLPIRQLVHIEIQDPAKTPRADWRDPEAESESADVLVILDFSISFRKDIQFTMEPPLSSINRQTSPELYKHLKSLNNQFRIALPHLQFNRFVLTMNRHGALRTFLRTIYSHARLYSCAFQTPVFDSFRPLNAVIQSTRELVHKELNSNGKNQTKKALEVEKSPPDIASPNKPALNSQRPKVPVEIVMLYYPDGTIESVDCDVDKASPFNVNPPRQVILPNGRFICPFCESFSSAMFEKVVPHILSQHQKDSAASSQSLSIPIRYPNQKKPRHSGKSLADSIFDNSPQSSNDEQIRLLSRYSVDSATLFHPSPYVRATRLMTSFLPPPQTELQYFPPSTQKLLRKLADSPQFRLREFPIQNSMGLSSEKHITFFAPGYLPPDLPNELHIPDHTASFTNPIYRGKIVSVNTIPIKTKEGKMENHKLEKPCMAILYSPPNFTGHFQHLHPSAAFTIPYCEPVDIRIHSFRVGGVTIHDTPKLYIKTYLRVDPKKGRFEYIKQTEISSDQYKSYTVIIPFHTITRLTFAPDTAGVDTQKEQGLVIMKITVGAEPTFTYTVGIGDQSETLPQPDFLSEADFTFTFEHIITFHKEDDLNKVFRILEHSSTFYSLILRSTYSQIYEPLSPLTDKLPPEFIPIEAVQKYCVIPISAWTVDYSATNLSSSITPLHNVAVPVRQQIVRNPDSSIRISNSITIYEGLYSLAFEHVPKQASLKYLFHPLFNKIPSNSAITYLLLDERKLLTTTLFPDVERDSKKCPRYNLQWTLPPIPYAALTNPDLKEKHPVYPIINYSVQRANSFLATLQSERGTRADSFDLFGNGFGKHNVEAAMMNLYPHHSILEKKKDLEVRKQAIFETIRAKYPDIDLDPNATLTAQNELIEKYIENSDFHIISSASASVEKRLYCKCRQQRPSANTGTRSHSVSMPCHNISYPSDGTHDQPTVFAEITCPCLLAGEPCSPLCDCCGCNNPLNTLSIDKISICAQNNLLSYLYGIQTGYWSEVVGVPCENHLSEQVQNNHPEFKKHFHPTIRGNLLQDDFVCLCGAKPYFSFCSNSIVFYPKMYHCADCRTCRTDDFCHCYRCGQCHSGDINVCPYCSNKEPLDAWAERIRLHGKRSSRNSLATVNQFGIMDLVSKNPRWKESVQKADRVVLCVDPAWGNRGAIKKNHDGTTSLVGQILWIGADQAIVPSLVGHSVHHPSETGTHS